MAKAGPDQAARIRLTAVIEAEGTQFTARCPELDVATCGDSVEEAYVNLLDATELYLDTLKDTGQLGRVLEQRGLEPGDSARHPVFTAAFSLLAPVS